MRKHDVGKQAAHFRTRMFMIRVLQGKSLHNQTLGNVGSVEAVLPTSKHFPHYYTAVVLFPRVRPPGSTDKLCGIDC